MTRSRANLASEASKESNIGILEFCIVRPSQSYEELINYYPEVADEARYTLYYAQCLYKSGEPPSWLIEIRQQWTCANFGIDIPVYMLELWWHENYIRVRGGWCARAVTCRPLC